MSEERYSDCLGGWKFADDNSKLSGCVLVDVSAVHRHTSPRILKMTRKGS
jgi:hypothetical protein